MTTEHRHEWGTPDHDRLIRLEAEVCILKRLVYGAVSIILGGVLAAVLALVLR